MDDAHLVHVRDGLEHIAGPPLDQFERELPLLLDEVVEVRRGALHGDDAAVLRGAEDMDDVRMGPHHINVLDLELHCFEHVIVGHVRTGTVRSCADVELTLGAYDFEGDVAAGSEFFGFMDSSEGALPDHGAHL